MKNRVYFRNIVVSADDLPKINQLVRNLSDLAPSDAFISVEFTKNEEGFCGTMKLSSACHNLTETSKGAGLLPLMQALSKQTMVYINDWKATRFTDSSEKLIS